MQRWEYKLVTSKDFSAGMFRPTSRAALEAALNELGREGWEVVSMDFDDELVPAMKFAALLKRPLAG